MKQLTLYFYLITIIGFSQNINDALYFSQESNLGTARYNAMGGAFGALGGDLSAINDNPASSAVFINSIFTGTLTHLDNNNTSTYFGTNSRSSSGKLAINQLGGAYIMNNFREEASVKKVALAFNYQQTSNFHNEIFISGNSNNSISSYFLSNANGLAFSDIQILPGEFIEEAYLNIGSQLGYNYQQAFLGYYGGVIDPADPSDPNNTVYVPTGEFSASGTVNQDYSFISSGANSRFNINTFVETCNFSMNLNN